MCVFHVFGGYRLTKTTIIIGSGGSDVCISRVWRVSAGQKHYNHRGLGGLERLQTMENVVYERYGLSSMSVKH